MDTLNDQGVLLKPLAKEVALAIEINGIAYTVMMVSPEDLEAFVTGILFSEGLIKTHSEIRDFTITQQSLGLCAHVELSHRRFHEFKQRLRTIKGNATCGLCGLESLQQAFPEYPKLVHRAFFDVNHLIGIREKVDAYLLQDGSQSRISGAMHAALLLSWLGQIEAHAEDIGRHNALDKIIGQCLLSESRLEGAVVLLTSRCGVELVQKAINAKLNTLISLSSPSDLSVKLAYEHNLQLIHVPKTDAPRVFARNQPISDKELIDRKVTQVKYRGNKHDWTK